MPCLPSFCIPVVALCLAGLSTGQASAAPLSGVARVAGGYVHTCALTTGGGVKCWGRNDHGNLGDGTLTDRAAPVDVVGLASGISAIDAGEFHTCVLTIGGAVKCWGQNDHGQLGDGTLTDRRSPVNVSGLASGVVTVAAGNSHTCALTSAGGVKCWGNNYYGALGIGSSGYGVDAQSPRDVINLGEPAAAIAAGGTHTCALMTNGGVKCWGSNSRYQLGNGTIGERTTPTSVVGLSNGVSAISLGMLHSCALMTDGTMRCWGDNGWGQLGDGTTTNRAAPTIPSGLASDVVEISLGDAHTCALRSTGGVKCWGSNYYRALGDGTQSDRHVPTDVSALASGATSIAAGGLHSCAVLDDTTVKCWGLNLYGEVGVDSTGNFQPVPVTVGSRTQQTITFAALGNHSVDEAPFALSASASSGLPVVFLTYTPAACTVSVSTLTLLAIGVCSVGADQSGDIDYGTAPEVVQTFLVAGSKPGSPARLANISTRVQVQAGEDVAIAGFVIDGSTSKTVLLRALGPSLSSFGIPNALANPLLRLLSGASVIARNDDWQGDTTREPNDGPINRGSASTIQSIGLAPSDPRESAILMTLPPGAYTAIVSGVAGATGVGLVEVYEIDHSDVPLINISTRGRVQTGFDMMIGGFVIQGTSPQTVVVRAIGPSLANYGITGSLANPYLELVRMSDNATIATNDDWGSASNAAQISSSGFAPTNSLESAIMMTLAPGAYTAVLSDVGGGTGVGLVEVYKVGP